MRPFLVSEVLSFLQEKLQNKPLWAVFLYGSVAQGTDDSDSDIDLALLAQTPFDRVDLWSWAQALAAHFGRDVDLLDFRVASTVMQSEILRTGQCIYRSEAVPLDLYLTFVLSERTALDEARAGLLSDIAARGSVFKHGDLQ